ncbi:hypothetical protein UAJ10_18265 [Nitrospirillum sp. BR 11164]|uniref:hypothetical protein n=1 Tax=Nitrospirillum sp. BR 11164 TaxID=3104324 RepID=UPI002AFE0BE2|nr:hypothetical protein [Nitrospirillum sp. BR 11164]MEA1650954.1 hypothetical protein [Nitrospirillum sp. BR 11164]
MKLGILKGLQVLALILAGTTTACADDHDRFLGKWTDNSPQRDPIGGLEITNDKITLGKVTYDVAPQGTFGQGTIYAVKGLNSKTDPHGCGPTGKLTYLVVNPLPPDPSVNQDAIVVIFYSGPNAPKPETIKTDFGVCGQHPFGRNK